MGTKKDLVVLIEHLVSEAVDQALAVSNQRRKESQDQFAKVYTEADATTPPPADQTTPPPPASAPAGTPPAPTTPGVPPVGDPGTAVVTPPPGDPGAIPGAEGGEEGTDTTGGDMGSGGGGFGGFGGGGGGGGAPADDAPGGDDSGDTEDTGDAGGDPEGDPIENMVSSAQELLNQTQDPMLILKSLKGQIQAVFEQPENALGVVKALYDTKDSVLMSVAQRLYLFLKSSGQ